MPRFDVTIAGELNLDLILYGLPDQLPPERELLADRMMLTLGSSSAIVAHNLAALGSRVGFQSRIGDDQLGLIALERLRHGGVDVSLVRRVPGATTTGLTVILHHERWRNILTYSGTIAELAGTISTSTISPTPVTSIFLPIICRAACGREWRTVSAPEIEGAHHFARHQRRSRRPLARRTAGRFALRRCLPSQRARSLQRSQARTIWRLR